MLLLGLSIVMLGAQALGAIAAIVSAARAHLAWPLFASGAIGILVLIQAALLRIEPWALAASFVAAIAGIASIHAKARHAANAEDERALKGKTSALVGLACLQAAILTAVLFGRFFVER
jgi:hypothetical protein